MVYVDDFKKGGPEGAMAEGWNLIRKGVQMDDPEPATVVPSTVAEQIMQSVGTIRFVGFSGALFALASGAYREVPNATEGRPCVICNGAISCPQLSGAKPQRVIPNHLSP